MKNIIIPLSIAICLLIANGNYSYSQTSVDSIFYSQDRNFPALLVLSEKQKMEIALKISAKDKISKAREAARVIFKLPGEVTLELQDQHEYPGETFVAFAQYYKGVRVDKSRCVVHSKDGVVDFVTGNLRTVDMSVLPALTEARAFQSFAADAGIEKLSAESVRGNLIIYFNEKDEAVLSYKFNDMLNEVYINAGTGAIEGKNSTLAWADGNANTRYSGTKTIVSKHLGVTGYHLHDTIKNITTYNGRNSHLPGHHDDKIITDNVQYTSTSKDWTILDLIDKAALDAHWGAAKTYDYYKETFGAAPFPQNFNLKIYANVNFPVLYNDPTQTVNSAVWRPSNEVAYFGIGDNVTHRPFTSLDIVAHEVGHAITNRLRGGAPSISSIGSISIVEGFSDIWAMCVEKKYKPHAVNNWKLGKR
jgi:Zn-dependent metalloprotease